MKHTYRLTPQALDDMRESDGIPSPNSQFWQCMVLIGIIGIIITELVWMLR